MNGKTVAIIVGVGLTFGLGMLLLKKKPAPAQAAAPKIKILAPLAGETVGPSTKAIELRWMSENMTGPVHIFYHINGPEDSPWILTEYAPDVRDEVCEVRIPEAEEGSVLALGMGIWDWDKDTWIMLDSVENLRVAYFGAVS